MKKISIQNIAIAILTVAVVSLVVVVIMMSNEISTINETLDAQLVFAESVTNFVDGQLELEESQYEMIMKLYEYLGLVK